MAEEKLEIFYIRHAETNPSVLESSSTCDVGLSETGEKQLILLGERFAGKTFDAVFSSPLVRAVKTAAAVLNRLDDPPLLEIMPEIIENGSLQGFAGIDMDILKKHYGNIKLCPDKVCKNGFRDLEDEDNDARAREVIAYLKSRFTYGQRVAVFAHGSFGNHFIPAAVEMGAGNYILSINNTSVTKIKYTPDGKQRISFMNDFSHLRPLMPDYEFTV